MACPGILPALYHWFSYIGQLLNEALIMREEVQESGRKMKTGLDGCAAVSEKWRSDGC